MPPHPKPIGQDPYTASRPPKPKKISEVPRYLKGLIVPTFSRLFYIFKLVWETKKSLLFLQIFMSVFNGIAPVIGSLIAAEILNKLAQVYSGAAMAFSVISVLLVCQFAYMILQSLVEQINSVIIGLAGEQVANHVKMKIMEKAKSIDMVSYDMPEFYSKMENANREAGMRPLQVMSNSFSIISAVITIVSYIAVLASVNTIAPLLIIVVAVPQTVINFYLGRKNVDYMFRSSKTRRQMEYYSSTIVNKDMAKEIRMLGLGDAFCEKYAAAFREYFNGLKKLRYRAVALNISMVIVTNVVYCLLYISLAKGVFNGIYEVGNFSLYTGAITHIGSGVSSLIALVAAIYESTLFINNLKAFLDEEPHITPLLPEARPVARHVPHRIEFENVYFRYPGTERDVIKNMSFVIEPGEAVVIVGINGAGKTTLIKLLMRLYDPSEGRIILDGRDIREYDPKELYSIFGVVFQDFGKYAVTVSENIEFGDLDKNAGEEAVRDAAVQSGADSFIDKLPRGYDTPLMRYFESDGIELSIGQWQKLSIARAFYSDSDILILDEPTASLDPMAEQEIYNRFNSLRKGKTSIFISHRLSSATTADKILVIEDGQLIEQGSHHQLMRDGGRYSELFSTQAAHYIENMGSEPIEKLPEEMSRPVR
ncbi:MAG: ABC transporter ATP-binding protein [Clostridiales bacterium]|nr:ABC transporter ATP-binding protein [Clostridiales bacterium]